ncbi:SDR family oxidoreductase [Microbacterium sp. MPKO10]|uniref:SDR family oxidoreductase n=1 Tax=Microbacterium sp. MPKO10 TaxID=2989818 RepID=UPI002235A5FC|nr:SDR family oxidoreductase [Microbacterium sp. MPKO10]MCW4457165.1 SDR family oxidoreductase [Microbacterium sp. MPKO10]
MTTTILVTGATGTIGAALVPELVRRGATVRTMSRREHELSGTQNAVADLRDPASLERAVAGTDTVFLNSPSEPDAAMLQCRFADIAAAAGVRRLVLLSQYAADADSPVRFLRWHAEVEHHVRELGIDSTVLRPNLYMQGLLPFAANAARTGALAAPIENARVSAIDTRDIAEVAAAVLTESGHAGATYTLTGPRAVTHAEIAAALSQATGLGISFAPVSAEQFAAALGSFLPSWQVDGLLEDYAHYDRGEAAEVYSTVSDLLGRPARSIEQFAHDHATAISAAD